MTQQERAERLIARLAKLNKTAGEERFGMLIDLAADAQKLLEECLNAAVDMDLSTEHNIEAHNVARANACFDPLQGRVTRQENRDAE